jgi:hypothetical protein
MIQTHSSKKAVSSAAELSLDTSTRKTQPDLSARAPFAQEPHPIGNQAALRRLESVGPSSSAHLATLQSFLGNQGVLRRLQAQGIVNTPGDRHEQEADRVADQVMRTPGSSVTAPVVASTASGLQRKCACGGHCPECRGGRGGLGQRTTPQVAGGTPAFVNQVLGSSGEPLDVGTREFLEERFGHQFGHVRVHTGPQAAASAAALDARAYTVGSHIVFGAGRYAPGSEEGRRLLAHELTHVVQQGGDHHGAPLQRFAASETDRIAPTFADMLAQVKTLIDAATTTHSVFPDELDMDFLVEIAGGTGASREMGNKLGSKSPTIKSRLLLRYLFTCRCGLIDMRHFFQLLYISNFAAGFETVSQQEANRIATKKGREHELTAEAASRFGAEDTPSNALGALTNVGLAATPGPDAVFDAIKDTLTRCGPVDWSSLSKASKDTIIHYYGDMVADPAKAGDMIPKNQEQTAVPVILDVPECRGKERSLPFSIDTSDSDRKTLGGRNFLGGSAAMEKGKDVKAFVATQRPEIIQALPLSEKIRLLNILLDPPVDDDDREAVAVIHKNSTAKELQAEP